MQDDVLSEEGRTQVVAIIPVQPCILGTALGLGCHCEDYSWRLPASVRWDLVGDPCGVSPARARNSAIKKEFSERSPIYSDLGGQRLASRHLSVSANVGRLPQRADKETLIEAVTDEC